MGICGLGTVGSGLFNLFADNRAELARKVADPPVLAQVGCRRDHPDCDLSATSVTRDIFEVAANPEVDLLVELIGGVDTAKELALQAIANGKHLVTANKALIALHGHEIFDAAAKQGVAVRYEASIAGGIPIVKALREGLAGNRIDWVAGIINGTANFILSEMSKPGVNRAFADVLREAQALGYAEADPAFDIEGTDAAHKLTILASLAFGIPLDFPAIYTEGISGVTTEDIRFADELGYCIKHLGIARRNGQAVELRVHPTLVAKDDMLSHVNGVMNAVMVGANAAGATMYYGAGAGAGPTASAVMADIIDAARGARAPDAGFTTPVRAPLLPMSGIETSCYLRLGVEDRAGVMADVSTILSDHKVSIEALIQKDARINDARIVIVTNEAPESEIDAAMAELASLDAVTGGIARIRIANL